MTGKHAIVITMQRACWGHHEYEFFYTLDGPLDTMPTGRQVRIAKLQGFPAFAWAHGRNPNSILERYDIDSRLLRDPDHYVDSKSIVDLFEYCSRSFNDPLFGLELAEHQEPEVFGCVATLCRAAPSLREAIKCFIDYIPIVHSPTASLQLVEGKKTAEIRWDVPADIVHNSQANYQSVRLVLKLLRQIGVVKFKPTYVNLATDTRYGDISKVEHRLGCSFHRTKLENAIAFPVEALNQSVVSANRIVFRLLGSYLERVKICARTSLVERVQDYIRGSLPTGTTSIERCSQKLGMSVRTLQARLEDGGFYFSDVVDQQRCDVAINLLLEQNLSLTTIAATVGYADLSSFGRAFKRWTGATPRLYRDTYLSSTKPGSGELENICNQRSH